MSSLESALGNLIEIGKAKEIDYTIVDRTRIEVANTGYAGFCKVTVSVEVRSNNVLYTVHQEKEDSPTMDDVFYWEGVSAESLRITSAKVMMHPLGGCEVITFLMLSESECVHTCVFVDRLGNANTLYCSEVESLSSYKDDLPLVVDKALAINTTHTVKLGTFLSADWTKCTRIRLLNRMAYINVYFLWGCIVVCVHVNNDSYAIIDHHNSDCCDAEVLQAGAIDKYVYIDLKRVPRVFNEDDYLYTRVMFDVGDDGTVKFGEGGTWRKYSLGDGPVDDIVD